MISKRRKNPSEFLLFANIPFLVVTFLGYFSTFQYLVIRKYCKSLLFYNIWNFMVLALPLYCNELYSCDKSVVLKHELLFLIWEIFILVRAIKSISFDNDVKIYHAPIFAFLSVQNLYLKLGKFKLHTFLC